MQSQNKRRDFHHQQGISDTFAEGWVRSRPRQDVFLSEECEVFGTRYFTGCHSTNSKARGRTEELEVTTE